MTRTTAAAAASTAASTATLHVLARLREHDVDGGAQRVPVQPPPLRRLLLRGRAPLERELGRHGNPG